MSKKFKYKEWKDKGEGGEWYEPYVTNGDLILMAKIYLVVCAVLFILYALTIVK